MNPLAWIVGIGFISFIILYFAFNTKQDEHPAIRLFLVIFAFILLVFIPKVILDDNQNCQIVLNSTHESYIYGDNFTDYHWDYVNNSAPKIPNDAYLFHKNVTNTYENVCFESDKTTATNFYVAILWLYRVFAAYVIFYMVWYFGGLLLKKKRDGK